jgi:hypothetical protein
MTIKLTDKEKVYWDIYYDDVSIRENFKKSHEQQLMILCQLHIEADELRDIVSLVGYTFSTGDGRNGDQEKIRPEVVQLNKVRSDIRGYHKILGLVLYKDVKTNEPEEDGDDWS